MDTETKVYLNWYDFQKQTEYICKGEVVDNELWAGTKQANMINVQFLIPGMSAPICHHFHAEKLSLTPDNVPHDDCYLVSGKNNTAYEPLSGGNLRKPSTKTNPSEAWQTIQKFKEEHWNQERNHLRIDALNDFYRLWRIAVAARYGVTIEEAPVTVVAVDPGSPDGDKSATIIVDTETGEILPELPAEVGAQAIVNEYRYQELKEKMKVKLTKKQKNSTGRIEYSDSIQTSLFD